MTQREPKDYADLSNFVAQTAVRALEAADADGTPKQWWSGHLPSADERVRDLRVGGFFEFIDNVNGRTQTRYYRVVAMAASREGFISVIAYADPEFHVTPTGERVPIIRTELMVHREEQRQQEEQRQREEQRARLPRTREWSKPFPEKFREMLDPGSVNMQKVVLIYRKDSADDEYGLRLFDTRDPNAAGQGSNQGVDRRHEVEQALAQLFGRKNTVTFPGPGSGQRGRWDFNLNREQYDLIGR